MPIPTSQSLSLLISPKSHTAAALGPSLALPRSAPVEGALLNAVLPQPLTCIRAGGRWAMRCRATVVRQQPASSIRIRPAPLRQSGPINDLRRSSMPRRPTSPRTRPSGDIDSGTTKHHATPQVLSSQYSVSSPCRLHKTIAASTPNCHKLCCSSIYMLISILQ
jgi:hypothetical protein